MARHLVRCIWVLVFVCTLCLPASSHARQSAKILLINSYHHGFDWTDDIVSGVRSVLNKDDDIRIEYMDTRRIFSKEYLKELYQSFRIKFKNQRYDVVIVSDDPALELMLDLHQELFPGTPVVFCGINDFIASRLRGESLYTGVVENVDLKSTLDVAHKLHPKAGKVIAFFNSNATGIANKRLLEKTIPMFKGIFEFEIVQDPELTLFLERLKHLPKDEYVVLLTGRFKSAKGEEIPINVSTPRIAETGIPSYSLWEYYLGHGIIGGRPTNGYYQGKTAGGIAMRILNGEKNIPVVMESPNEYMFDFRELKRFGIDTSLLPGGSIIINKPMSFYTRYRDAIRVAIAITLLCSAIIASLSIVIMQKNKAQEELRRYQANLELIVEERTSKLNTANTALIVEISERKQTEEALRQSRERLQTLVEATFEGIALTEKGRILEVNDQLARMLGYRADELIGMEVASVVFPEDRARGLENIQMEWESTTEHRVIRKDGTVITVEAHGKPFTHEGRLARVTVLRDITERKRARDILWSTLDRFYTILSDMYAAILLLTDDGIVEYANPAFCDFFGLRERPPQLKGLTASEMLAKIRPAYFRPEEAITRIRQIVQEGKPVKGEEVAMSNGKTCLRDFVPIHVGGKSQGRLWHHLDITERKQAEEILRRQNSTEEGINQILNAALTSQTEEELGAACLEVVEGLTQSRLGFIGYINENGLEDVAISNPGWEACQIMDAGGHRLPPGSFRIHGIYGRVLSDGKPLFTNDPARHPDSIGLPNGHPPLTAFLGVPLIREGRTIGMIAVGNRDGGYSNLEQDTIEKLMPAIVEAFLRKRAEEALRRAYDELELRVQERTVQLSEAYESLQRETEERKNAEEQLRHAQKMEAIGTLAGGIAHDFNNILAAILGFTEMTMEDLPDRPDLDKNLKNVMKSAMRARELVKQILTFSRKADYERNLLYLTPVVKETVQLLRASIPATIDIRLSISATSDMILGSPVEIQQILMNLATNASLAMEEKGGAIEVSLTDIDFEPESAVFGGVEPGEYLQLMVKDTGIGMSLDIMKRVFEPFFTTREVGKGTGLGLAVVYGIVRDLQGTITVESELGIGSTFRVFIPKAKTDAEAEAPKPAEIRGGNERILFVDDEEMLAEWGKATLERLGYRVTAVTDSVEALNTFSIDPSLFDLVVTDLAMPQIAGAQLAQKLLSIRSDIPIILCSGHTETVSLEKAKKIGIREFLMKPLAKQELAAAVRRVLDKNAEI